MKKPLSREDLINLWLKYHNTTVNELVIRHTEEELKDWYNLYPVSQEQHDTWVTEAKAYIKHVTKHSKSYIEKGWGMIYLNCAPNIKK